MNEMASSNNITNNQNNNQGFFEIKNYYKSIKKKISDKFKKGSKSNKYYVQASESDERIPKGKNTKIENKEKLNKRSFCINLLHVILFLISYVFYFLSLKQCHDGEDICTLNESWIAFIIITVSISIIINAIMFILLIFNKASSLHLIHFILIFIYFYQYSHQTIAEDHGYYNFIAFFCLLWVSVIGELFIYGLVITLKSKYRYLLFVFLLLIIILIYIIYLFDPVNCDEWTLGLNNTRLENDINIYGCQVKIPKRCYYKIFSGTQDITKITKLDCSTGKKDARQTLIKTSTSPYINQNTKKFGFPFTNEEGIGGLDGLDKWVLINYTKENLIDMDNITMELKKWPEKIVDFTKDEIGEFIVNLTYNETLSKERKKLEKNSVPFSNNILIIYIDSVSRANGLRQLKKTSAFFEKFMAYEGHHHEKYPDDNFHSFQFFKYHAFRMYTPGNFPILFYGHPKEAKNIVLITRYLKENGYVTNYCSDHCQKDNTRTHHNMTNSELYDHQMLLCDPNVVSENKPVKKCIYGNMNIHHLYEYGKQFWIKYKENRKYLALVTNDGHESTLEALKYSDDIIYNYLNSFYEQNLLKDTTIFLMSDHGTTLPSLYYLTDFFQIEARLPMLYVIVNDRENVSYYEQYYNIQKNQQTFITGYDFYNTLGNIIYGDKYSEIKNKTEEIDTPKSPFGQSLFDYIKPKKRTPKNYERMAQHICI